MEDLTVGPFGPFSGLGTLGSFCTLSPFLITGATTLCDTRNGEATGRQGRFSAMANYVVRCDKIEMMT